MSVIIPCYNHARYLGGAIESVLAQSQAQVEIIVVDDGSTDDTADVAARYPSVRYVRQENQGLSAARNAGLGRSRGRFLIFLDADDRLLPRAVEAGLRSFDQHPDSAFAYGAFQWIGEEGVVSGVQPVTEPGPDAYLGLLSRNFIGMHAAVMYRRAALESIGGFDTALRACEDYDVYLRLSRRFPVHCHLELVAEYRRHESNMSSDETLIAESALAVLRRQWQHVRKDPHRRGAYMAGVSYWVTTYGKAGLWAAAAWRLRGEGWRGLRGVAVLARRAPEWYARVLLKKVRRTAHWLRHGNLHGVPDRLPPPPGHVRFGDLRRMQPVDPCYGFLRGRPIDRYYIERFLAAHAEDVRGRVLEVGDDAYTRRFGGDRVLKSDILDVDPRNPMATVVADLALADAIPACNYDCVVLTQTLQFIYDVPAALASVHRILKPGGVALVTVPGITRTDASGPWYWMFTTASARRLFADTFPGARVTVDGHGNVFAATAFLMGLAVAELDQRELDEDDPDYPVCITVRAEKAARQS